MILLQVTLVRTGEQMLCTKWPVVTIAHELIPIDLLQVLRENESVMQAALLDIVAFYERVRSAREHIIRHVASHADPSHTRAWWPLPRELPMCPHFSAEAACTKHNRQDPACVTYSAALLYFKGYHAIQTHRIGHILWQADRKVRVYSRKNAVAPNCATHNAVFRTVKLFNRERVPLCTHSSRPHNMRCVH